MANPEHVAKLSEGTEAWNQWRKDHPDIHYPDLALTTHLIAARLVGANLAGTDLVETNLAGTDLSEADLSGANLIGAALRGAKVAGANLGRAKLCGTNLGWADLGWANLSEADLSGANLGWANLHGADLHEAVLGETIFGDTDLSGAKGLGTCVHTGPCIIDHRTLAKSGSLPLDFLRGCGLPDALITYLPSLLNQPIQRYSCFISYSTKDQQFAERLHADLQNKGVRCWFAPHDMQSGKKIHEQIDEGDTSL